MKRPQRPKGRPAGRSRSGKPAYGRRTPPPERTGLEAEFISSSMSSDRRLTVQMRSGETFEGTVEQFDRDVITLRPSEGPPIVLRKQDIRYLSE